VEKIDIKSLSKEDLKKHLIKSGSEPYRVGQISRWLYKAGVKSFDEMLDIPEALRAGLKAKFHINHLVILDHKSSRIDGTTKYLFKLEDGNTIETVFLPEERRNTICLSSQVGCKFSCSFCASAPFGFIRNLHRSEIIDQVLAIKARHPSSSITNLVFMGIGEPLDNYDNVLGAIRVFNDKDAFGIGSRKITISTCGIVPAIEKLKDEGMQVELSISLHSADDSVRSTLVPVNKRYPLKELIGACKDYIQHTNRVITFEYILIKGVNSSTADAIKLAALLKGIKCKVNTIAYNKIRAKDYAEPDVKYIKEFMDTLRRSGINATHRKSKGEDIDAGCGQLRISKL